MSRGGAADPDNKERRRGNQKRVCGLLKGPRKKKGRVEPTGGVASHNEKK